MPLISVLIPAYNAGPYLRQTLDSVLAQSVQDWECIIVDDASTDDTAAVAQDYVDRDARFRLHRIRPEEKRPHPASRNVALSLATGEWISPLDADDWWEPWKLERQLEAVNARPGVVMCACPMWIWVDGKVTRRSIELDPRTIGKDLLIACVTANSVLARREAVIDAGGYDPDMLLAEDWDLWTRVALRFGFDGITAINEPCMFYRRHANNITSDTWRNIRYDRKLVRKLLLGQGLLWKHPMIALKIIDAQNAREMRHHAYSGRRWWAKYKSIHVIAFNPIKPWRWQNAAVAWRKPASAS